MKQEPKGKEAKKMEEKNQPETRFRAGAVSATVWLNQVKRQNGETGAYRTVSLDRRYKDKDGNWKSSGSLRASDLPRAVLVLNKAFEYVAMSKDSSADDETEKE
jgi:hypothetical protein